MVVLIFGSLRALGLSPNDVQDLVERIEQKDLSTAAHTWRVVLYARALAESLDIEDGILRRITHAAALHDIGKIDIPDRILQKPGPLTATEYETIKAHAALGHARLVSMGEHDPILLNLVRHHHERWDGRGYPDEMADEEIPVGARLFAVIDSFDAMTSIRPYRRDVGPGAAKRAIDELIAGSGTMYWPEAVELFVALLHRGGLDWISEYFNDEASLPGCCGTEASLAHADRARM